MPAQIYLTLLSFQLSTRNFFSTLLKPGLRTGPFQASPPGRPNSTILIFFYRKLLCNCSMVNGTMNGASQRQLHSSNQPGIQKKASY